MQHKLTTGSAEMQRGQLQGEIETEIINFRHGKNFKMGDIAFLMTVLFDYTPGYWIECYTDNLLELLTALSEEEDEAKKIVNNPADHRKMLLRFLSFFIAINGEKKRYFSEIDLAIFAGGYLPVDELGSFQDRLNELYKEGGSL